MIRILGLFWSTALAAELEYRLNFVLAAINSLGNLVGSIFGVYLFYGAGYRFSGWSWEAALVVLGFFTILEGFTSTFLSPNLSKLVTYVQEGTLDFVLLKPISSQFWLSTRTLSPWGLPNLLFGVLLILYAGNRLDLHLSDYLLSLFPLLFGLVILYSLWFMIGATSIWFVKIYNATEVLRGLLEAGRYPMIAYPAAYRFFLTFIVPVAFLTTIPSEVLLGKIQPGWLFGSGILAVALLVCSNYFWKFALRFYTSASS